MFVADLPIAQVLLFEGFQRRRRHDRDEHLALIVLPLVYRNFPLLVLDFLVAEYDIERAEDGVFAHAAFRDIELQLPRRLREAGHPDFIPLPGLGEILLRHIPLGFRSLGHLGRFVVVIDVVLQFFDMVALLFERVEHLRRGFVRRGERRTGVVREEFHGFLYQKLVVLAHHALPVLASCAAVRTFVAEQHLVGRVVGARPTFGLVETVGLQLGHIPLVKPPCDLLDTGVFPRGAALVGEVLLVDLLLNVGRIFGDLHSDTHRNLLPVELAGQSVDELAELQTRADVGFALAELTHEALDRVPPRLQGPFVCLGLFARLHVLALEVLRDSRVFGLGVGHLPHEGRDELQIRHRGRPVAALAVDDFEAFALRAYADGLQYPDLTDTLGKLQQRLLPEVLARVVLRVDDFVQVEQSNLRIVTGLRLLCGSGCSCRKSFFRGRRLCLGRYRFCGLAASRRLRFRHGGFHRRNGRQSVGGLAAFSRLRTRFRCLHNIGQFLPCVSRV